MNPREPIVMREISLPRTGADPGTATLLRVNRNDMFAVHLPAAFLDTQERMWLLRIRR